MTIQVFVQNEAGSHRKRYHDETTLRYLRSTVVAHAYPFPLATIVSCVG